MNDIGVGERRTRVWSQRLVKPSAEIGSNVGEIDASYFRKATVDGTENMLLPEFVSDFHAGRLIDDLQPPLGQASS